MQFEQKNFLAGVGHKYWLAINFGSQNFFTFTGGDGHSTNVVLVEDVTFPGLPSEDFGEPSE